MICVSYSLILGEVAGGSADSLVDDAEEPLAFRFTAEGVTRPPVAPFALPVVGAPLPLPGTELGLPLIEVLLVTTLVTGAFVGTCRMTSV